MDKNHVHSFWGNSPALDVRSVIGATSRTGLEDAVKPLSLETESATATVSVLQLGAADCRHSILTLCRSHRWHPYPANLELVVYESEIACIARHMLLMSVFLHEEVLLKERAEVFLELYWNCLLRQRTAEYMQERARLLADVVLASLEGKLAGPTNGTGMDGSGAASELDNLKQLFDLSNLKYKEKDDLVDTFRQWSLSVPFDMEGQWDKRMRQLHGERYDFRKNMVDWDYHMRLEKEASVVHFRHFRDWRENGVAYQIRESAHTVPNRSLCSYVTGTAVHCVDVSGKERGRSVMRRGYWGDIVNSPYMTLGVATEEPSLLKKSNMQHVKTAVDVAEYNLATMLHELTQGRRYQMPAEADKELSTAPQADGQDGEESSDAATKKEPEAGTAERNVGQGIGEGRGEGGADLVAVETCEGEQEGAPGAQQPGDVVAGSRAEGRGSQPRGGSEEGGDGGHGDTNGGLETRGGGDGGIVAKADARGGHVGVANGNGVADGSQSMASDGPLAREVVRRCKLTFVTGDASKNLFTRAKFANKFDAIVVGEWQLHQINQGLHKVAKPVTTRMVVETAKYLLLLRKEQVQAIEDKIAELAQEHWKEESSRPEGLDSAHKLYSIRS